MTPIRPVILSGGSGTRLWPLSTPENPKQFVELFPGQAPLFEMTATRLTDMKGVAPPIVVTGADHRDLVQRSLDAVGLSDALLVIEPAGRNTAPAAVAAALVADPGDCLVLLPADHLITDVDRFTNHVREAVEAAGDGTIVTFGIEPTRPETGYGYIEMGTPAGPGRQVRRFKEKPDLEEAIRLAGDGAHVWNSGMFVANATTILSESRLHRPDVVDGVERATPTAVDGVVALGAGFEEVDSISFDHAVMERTEESLVIPIAVGWDDIGSYRALWEATPKDSDRNVVIGDVIAEGVTNSYLRSVSGTLAVTDMDGVVAVRTADASLLVPMEASQAVRDLAGKAGGG